MMKNLMDKIPEKNRINTPKTFWLVVFHIVCCGLLILFLIGSLGLIISFFSRNLLSVIAWIILIGTVILIFISIKKEDKRRNNEK